MAADNDFWPHETMTPEQIKLVRSTFATAYFDREESAKVFYDRLFEVAPELRALFPADMEKQYAKLMDTLALVVTALSNPASLDALVYDTAKRHVGYGAQPAHYDVVGDALLWMLHKQLGADFTPAARGAWAAVYRMVADAMLRIGREAEAVEPR